MKLQIDTNIILDFLQKREPYYEDASAIFQLSVDNEVIECVTASSITDIYYLVNKEFKDVKKTKERIQDLLELITILDVTNKVFNQKEAISVGMASLFCIKILSPQVCLSTTLNIPLFFSYIFQTKRNTKYFSD